MTITDLHIPLSESESQGTSFPFIIWCRQRTGSISLFSALCSASEHTPAEIEPFDFGNVSDRQFTDVGKRMGNSARDWSLRNICDQRLLIKHCYENLSEEFNHALAKISTLAGYRHIHLVRKDEVARLISKGIAEQHGTWGAHDWTFKRYDEWLANGKQLPPLNVAALKKYSEVSEARWSAVGHLLEAHEVTFEGLFSATGVVLSRIAQYVGFPQSKITSMRDSMGTGQKTPSIWRLIPNIEELRRSVMVVAQ